MSIEGPSGRKTFSIMVLFILCLSAVPSMMAPVMASNDPSQPAAGETAHVVGDWSVETDLEYHDCTIDVSGDLDIRTGASLTLDNVTLKMNSTSSGEFGIQVQNGSAFYAYNGSVITAVNGAFHYTFVVNHTGTLVLDDVMVSECGVQNWPTEAIGLYVGSDDVIINNSVLNNNAYGLVVGLANITLTNSTLNNNQVHGAYFFGTEGGIYENLNLSQNGYYGLAMIFSVMSIRNVSVIQNSFDGFGTYRSNLTFEDIYSYKNTRLGILAQSSNITDHNSTYLKNTMCDVYLTGHNATSMTGPGGIDLYDVVFETYHLHDFTQSLNSTFSVNVSAEWADGGGIPGARFRILNNSVSSDGGEAFNGTTDAQGNITGVQLRVLQESIEGIWSYGPHTFRVEKDGFMGVLEFNVSEPWQDVLVLVDRSKPILNITSPLDGTLFNRSNVHVQGTAWDHDGISLVQVNWNGTDWEQAAGTESWYMDLLLPDGDHNVSVRVFDGYNVTNSSWVTFSIDTTPPGIAITSPDTGILTNMTTVIVTGTVEPGATVFMGPDDTVIDNDNGTFEFEQDLSEGSNTIGVKAMDLAGNWNGTEVTLHVDSIPPVLNMTWPPEGFGTTEDFVEITGKAPGATMISFSMGGHHYETEVVNNIFSHIVDLVEGTNRITVRAWDNAGNEDVEVVEVVRDTTRPPITATWEGGNLTNSRYITIDIMTELDANVTVNGIPVENTDGEILYIVELFEGLNRITVTAKDWLGNSNSTTIEVEADLTPPNLTIDKPEEGAVFKSRMVNVFGTALDNIIVVDVEIRVDDGDWMNCTGVETWFRTIEIVGGGLHTISVKAWDLAGNNITATVNISIIEDIVDTEPPIIKVTWPRDGSTVAAGSVTFSGTAFDDTGNDGIESVEWSTDGETWTPCGEPLYLWSTTIDLEAGEHTIYFRVTDRSGKTNGTSVSITARSAGPRSEDDLWTAIQHFWLIPLLIIAIVIVTVYMVISTHRYKKAIEEEVRIERDAIEKDERRKRRKLKKKVVVDDDEGTLPDDEDEKDDSEE